MRAGTSSSCVWKPQPFDLPQVPSADMAEFNIKAPLELVAARVSSIFQRASENMRGLMSTLGVDCDLLPAPALELVANLQPTARAFHMHDTPATAATSACASASASAGAAAAAAAATTGGGASARAAASAGTAAAACREGLSTATGVPTWLRSSGTSGPTELVAVVPDAPEEEGVVDVTDVVQEFADGIDAAVSAPPEERAESCAELMRSSMLTAAAVDADVGSAVASALREATVAAERAA